MKTHSRLLTAALVLGTLCTVPLSAAIYMKVEGVPGRATDARHQGWIEIESWSFGATPAAANTGNRVAGNFIGTDACATGHLTFKVKGVPPAEMMKMCRSGETRPTLVVEQVGGAGGDSLHTLQNVRFESCPTGDGSLPMDQFSINFSKCTTHAAAPTRGNAAPNAVLTGLPSGPVTVSMESLTLNGTGATLTLVKQGAGTLVLSSGAQIPVLTLELKGGPKWTFYEVKMEDILISSATAPPAAGTQAFSLNFTKMTGPTTGFKH